MSDLSHTSFFGKEYCSALKGICAIPVVLVHTPSTYQNPVQDAVGSFAYIAVTLFFMISAYGMKYLTSNDNLYMNGFWKGRLSSLLIPCAVANIISTLANWMTSGVFLFSTLFQINEYVLVLLEYCLAFYLVNILDIKYKDIVLIVLVIVSGLFLYFTREGNSFEWCFERFGLVWGLLLFRFRSSFVHFLSRHRYHFVIFSLLLSCFLGILYLHYKTVWFWGGFVLKIILGLSVILFIFGMTFSIGSDVLTKRLFRVLGDISYEVYLLHMTVFGVACHLCRCANSWIFITVTLVSTAFISYLTHQIDSTLIRIIRKN